MSTFFLVTSIFVVLVATVLSFIDFRIDLESFFLD